MPSAPWLLWLCWVASMEDSEEVELAAESRASAACPLLLVLWEPEVELSCAPGFAGVCSAEEEVVVVASAGCWLLRRRGGRRPVAAL